ncbi:MAG: asparagine synthase (glutamine-hydrolyzing) [Candidatus Zambryskibacteria bacterium RIFCSPHIGHO2_02_FULL_43_14]|uniref:asparagine synthase (glutamine-hydrolyzing) n=1 Tax=Candidatus Zambryskibacteria bacterium RIFCSPHIGHO2_02_FULL_43_14 TaxID=1802748 RepID=A0A1G2THR2_9BACT|nr:MAG: asparagine synthase (glutamine-hydrolyzing) [Candidatus Zambryskibacteria bacterium RIFCSPHIGHO2_01_FULL_43_60]OHA96827.1 MAG: asparagine synthase (glutamine-hydrolyzing) [Candidatus Zambryskibacteria bacterium RIFCSPHIGHO2_02_FULL_43_14]OHB04083.1 MAG: asparagine synthase (glutamine-hydrolyzing) [Candidatus Zambryskibacteria bacterium RIFCSPLOWO2_01_FULL_42_41]
MCGITGIINPKRPEIIKKMTDAIRHRGPDDNGYFTDQYLALGMRRLSIIDLARGKQPITSNDGRFIIFFNGEIYNYKEIKKELDDCKFETDSDTEVILAGFVKWGEKVLSRLRGMFAFAIYDKEKHKLILARDFFGIKPLYYLKNGDRIVAFSSEIKSFLSLPDFKPEINDRAVFNYLSFQYNPLEETFFKNVFKLPPAHYIILDLETGVAEIKKYWQFEFKQNNNLDEKNTKNKILEVMKDSVTHHMIADVPIGSFLSGGIDSSIIATLMQKIRGEKKIETFTVGFESLSEGKEARETAEPLETLHREISVGAEEYFKVLPKAIWHFDEPIADPSAIGLYFLAREAAKHVKVVLSGEGADELFGGYNIYLEPFARRWISWLPRFILQTLADLPFRGRHYAGRALSKLEDWYIGNASVFNKKEVGRLWKGNMSRVTLDSLYEKTTSLSDSTKMQYIDINTWLIGDILAKADKMTMAHSLELRVPFLDIEVANLAATLPDRFKWRDGATKYLLRETFKKILPESVWRRKKLGFPTPIRDWFTSDRTKLYNTILENSYIRKHMDTIYIRKLINDHTSKLSDNSRKIYLLLMLAIWYNVFIDGERP